MTPDNIPFTIALTGLSFMMTIIWGSPFIRLLRYLDIGEKIRVMNPVKDFTKPGTPTMGGVMIILTVGMLTVLLNAISLVGFSFLGLSILLPLSALVGFGALGAVSDWRRVRGKSRGGLRARTKFVVQLVMALFLSYALADVLDAPQMYFPFYPREITLHFWYFPIAAVIIVASANAINLTSGINGLPGLLSATAFATFGAIALIQGQAFLARFAFTITGALLGFLWFNVKPAALLMGNTGTYALGATLAVVALMTGHWVLLPLVAAIPMIETLSVILQFTYMRWSGGRPLFKLTPFHYHLELSGWSETQILQRFWLINLLLALIGVTLALV